VFETSDMPDRANRSSTPACELFLQYGRSLRISAPLDATELSTASDTVAKIPALIFFTMFPWAELIGVDRWSFTKAIVPGQPDSELSQARDWPTGSVAFCARIVFWNCRDESEPPHAMRVLLIALRNGRCTVASCCVGSALLERKRQDPPNALSLEHIHLHDDERDVVCLWPAY
jgi:hypothetical protein